MKHIVIIGAGWYGLHSFLSIKKRYKNCKVTILEREDDIFKNSSNFNQNRLHIGYHYPRSHTTRELCKSGYNKFISNYRGVVDFIDRNFYCISKDSCIDYDTYLKIYSNDEMYDHTILANHYLDNIDGNIINTKEKIINSEKARSLFKRKINKKNIKLNYTVKDIQLSNQKIIINDDISCDLLIDCSYNNLQLQAGYIYELTISLLYKKLRGSQGFDSLTIMDGDFFSLFPRDVEKNNYTLTHVKYTPLIKSESIDDINTFEVTSDVVDQVKQKMEASVKEYYSSFINEFEYYSYFTSFKCKSKTTSDSRKCNIHRKDNIISVNCGKITGIFEFEEYLTNYLNTIL